MSGDASASGPTATASAIKNVRITASYKHVYAEVNAIGNFKMTGGFRDSGKIQVTSISGLCGKVDQGSNFGVSFTMTATVRK